MTRRASDPGSPGVAWGNWLVDKVGGYLGNKTSRRGFLVRSALAGSAVAVAGIKYTTRPGSAFTFITDCPPEALCRDGYTEFCCVINNGVNACPPNTIAGGWWRADYSDYCSGTRYYLDCNEVCCGPPRGYKTFCNGCHECGCAGDCDTRKSYCTYFRYGQCNQDVEWIGPIACRMVTCVPPYTLALGCTADGAVDNTTADHTAPCLTNPPINTNSGDDDMPAVLVSDNTGAWWALHSSGYKYRVNTQTQADVLTYLGLIGSNHPGDLSAFPDVFALFRDVTSVAKSP